MSGDEHSISSSGASLVAQLIENPPAVQETWVRSLGWKDPPPCPGEGNGYPLQYSGLENSMDCIVHGVSKSQTQLSNFHFTSSSGEETEMQRDRAVSLRSHSLQVYRAGIQTRQSETCVLA